MKRYQTDNREIVNSKKSKHLDPKTVIVSTLAGRGNLHYGWKDGQGKDDSFWSPHGVAVDTMSGQVAVADTHNHSIRLVDIKTGMVSTLAGSGHPGSKDGQGQDAFFYPTQL